MCCIQDHNREHRDRHINIPAMEQVAELVDRFCKTEYSFQEHDDALEKIVTGIVGRLFTIADVVAAVRERERERRVFVSCF